MTKAISMVIYILVSFGLISCADSARTQDNSNIRWDFDHNVQFIKTQLTNNQYQLEIIPNPRSRFDKTAAFLLRKSYILCGSYHYKIEIIQGIEGFDDKRAMPNYIQPNLVAIIQCSIKKTPRPK